MQKMCRVFGFIFGPNCVAVWPTPPERLTVKPVVSSCEELVNLITDAFDGKRAVTWTIHLGSMNVEGDRCATYKLLSHVIITSRGVFPGSKYEFGVYGQRKTVTKPALCKQGKHQTDKKARQPCNIQSLNHLCEFVVQAVF